MSAGSLEMLDKVEPPSVVEGYGASVAYTCLIEIVRSLTLITDRVLPPEPTAEPAAAAADGTDGTAQKPDRSVRGVVEGGSHWAAFGLGYSAAVGDGRPWLQLVSSL